MEEWNTVENMKYLTFFGDQHVFEDAILIYKVGQMCKDELKCIFLQLMEMLITCFLLSKAYIYIIQIKVIKVYSYSTLKLLVDKSA